MRVQGSKQWQWRQNACSHPSNRTVGPSKCVEAVKGEKDHYHSLICRLYSFPSARIVSTCLSRSFDHPPIFFSSLTLVYLGRTLD